MEITKFEKLTPRTVSERWPKTNDNDTGSLASVKPSCFNSSSPLSLKKVRLY